MIAFMVILPAITVASERPNHGQKWNSLTEPERLLYLKGFKEGLSAGYFNTKKEFNIRSPKQPGSGSGIDWEKGWNNYISVVFPTDEVALHDMLTRLYADPANNFIEWERMIYLARDKIRGIDVSNRLIETREMADEVFFLMQTFLNLLEIAAVTEQYRVA